MNLQPPVYKTGVLPLNYCAGYEKERAASHRGNLRHSRYAGANRFSDTLASIASACKSRIYTLAENVQNVSTLVAGEFRFCGVDAFQDGVAQLLVGFTQLADVLEHSRLTLVFHNQLGARRSAYAVLG